MANQKHVVYTDPSRQDSSSEEEEVIAADYISNLAPIQAQQRRKRRSRIIMVVVLVLIAGGAGAYFMLAKPKAGNQQQNTSSNQSQQPTAPAVEVPTKNYVSQDLSLTLDYPENWEVKDDTQGLVTFTSPTVKLTDANGQQVDGRVVLTLLSAGSEVPGFSKAAGLAAMDSEKISYTSPTQNQRQKTYLSFVSLSGSGMDAVFITGDSGYKKDQNIPESDIKKVEPIVALTFLSCSEASCQGDTALAVAPDSWTTDNTLKVAKTMIKSLKIQ